MSLARLLDTNVAVAYLNGEQQVLVWMSEQEEMFLCATVLGELYYGAANSDRKQDNYDRIERLGRLWPVLPVDEQTARIYGETRVALKARGSGIPENDLWIAAMCLQHELMLVTREGACRGLLLCR